MTQKKLKEAHVMVVTECAQSRPVVLLRGETGEQAGPPAWVTRLYLSGWAVRRLSPTGEADGDAPGQYRCLVHVLHGAVLLGSPGVC